MRIISGKFKSRRLSAPKHLPVRPTTDRAKESLFNIINNEYYFDGLRVLDLFAGIGSISFEFASRGVTDITVVDSNARCIDFISKTAKDLEVELVIYNRKALDFINSASTVYDIVFADPPYDFSDEEFFEIIDAVFDQKLMSNKGIFILEHSKYTDVSAHPQFIKQRKYGHSVISWFE